MQVGPLHDAGTVHPVSANRSAIEGRRTCVFCKGAGSDFRVPSRRRERADRNVISVRISERELLGLRVRIHVRLLFEPRDESACPLQRQVEIIDTEEQQEPVARCRVIGAYQGGMLVSAPRVEAEQNSSIGIEDLPKVIMGRKGSRLAEQRLIPFEADRHVAYPDDRPRALHPVPLCGLILV